MKVLKFGGSSVAENSIFINGLNVTDFYRRQGFSTAPFAFYDEFQVTTVETATAAIDSILGNFIDFLPIALVTPALSGSSRRSEKLFRSASRACRARRPSRTWGR